MRTGPLSRAFPSGDRSMFFHVRRNQEGPRARATLCHGTKWDGAPRAHRTIRACALQIDLEKDLLLLPQHFGPNIKEHLRSKLIEKVREQPTHLLPSHASRFREKREQLRRRRTAELAPGRAHRSAAQGLPWAKKNDVPKMVWPRRVARFTSRALRTRATLRSVSWPLAARSPAPAPIRSPSLPP